LPTALIEIGLPPSASGWPLHTSDRSPILKFDPDREIVAIYVEGDVNIFRVQIRTGRIVKTPDFATGQNQATNGVWITRPSFEPIPKVDCAQFVLVGSL
jgi:hypothetical protein